MHAPTTTSLRRSFRRIRSLHRQLQAAAVVGLEDLDAHCLAFLQIIGHLIDALLGDLRDMQQAIAPGQDLHDRAEVEQAQHIVRSIGGRGAGHVIHAGVASALCH